MNSKKAITLLLIATMLLSITPVIVSNAITVDDIYVDGGPLPAEVYYGDTIIVEGSAATPSRDVKIYWDGIDELLNTTKAKGNGEWLVWFDVPDATYGAHYITVENVRNGDIYTLVSTPIMVGASLSVSPKAGLKGDTVTIKGHGFGDEVDVTIIDFNAVDLTTTPTTPTTNDVGYWTATFSVPIEAYGTYPVYAEDEDGHSASKDFKVGAAITLNKDSGPSGTVVRVTGRGFTPGAYINDTSVILLDTVECGLVTKNAKVKTNGEFVLDLVIPDVGEDEWTLSIQEWGGDDISATADFEQTGRPAIELTPEYGPVGGTITVKGYNFTQINGEDVDIELAGSGSIKTVETNSMGEFTATYRIPGASGTPDIVASQDKFNLEASAKFRVGFITVVIYPEECTAGERVTVSGSGFDELQTCNVTLDGDLWMDELDVGPGGVISETEYVPSMPAGVYDVVVTESDSGISVTVELTITENTYVTTSPMVAPPGYEVDIEGHNFAYDAVANNVETLTFVLYNETTEWSLSVEYDGATVALGDDADWDEGYFEGTFMLPDEDSISIGSYMINVTDGADMHAQIAFDIVDKTVDIEPKKTVFRVGETLGFNVESSFKQVNSYIKIWDPSGNLYWQTDAFTSTIWVKVGTIMRVPYYSQVAGGNPMTFLEDAPLGTWTWKWYDEDDEVLDEGAFTVDPAAADVVGEQVADLANQIGDLQQSLSDVSSEFDTVKSDIASVRAVAQQAATAAQQAATAVQTVAQTANQANTAAQNAADAANAAKDAANGLTTLVYGAIGAALVAALAAIVSLMQISRRIAG